MMFRLTDFCRRRGLVIWLVLLALFFAFLALPMALRWPARIFMVLLLALGLWSAGGYLCGLVKDRRRFTFGLIAMCLSIGSAYAVAEACSWLYLRSRPEIWAPAMTVPPHQEESIRRMMRWEDPYMGFSPSLGWTIRPNGVSKPRPRARSRTPSAACTCNV